MALDFPLINGAESPARIASLCDAGTAVGILCERPREHPPITPETVYMIWGAMCFAALMLLIIFGIGWADRRSKAQLAVPQMPKDVPAQPDQEWCHYPQPRDKPAGKATSAQEQ